MASNLVTKEIESRLKQAPEHIFEVFLEIHQPINNETPEILIKYPDTFDDQILKTAPKFAYPYPIPTDDPNENFSFVLLDSNASIFRFGYCRRSNRESTCLCLISYYPWFEVFYQILNDLAQLINSQSENEVDKFLSSLYNYKFLSMEGEELIVVNSSHQYTRPDSRKLPSILSDLNYTFLFSQFNTDLILRLFAHLLFERRILFISSKLFNLTACACACLHLIKPMHWQSVFLPILPQSMSWTTQCTAPYIIGIHSSIYSQLNRRELGDVVLVDIDQRIMHSPYEDWHLFPQDLIRQMKKDLQQASDERIARIFLRTMAMIVGNYPDGFVVRNDKLDFDRNVYLEGYRRSEFYRFMSTIVNTQMFEQFSRYRTSLHAERNVDMDEFEIEINYLQKNKILKTSRKAVNITEKKSNPLLEQIQNKAEKLHTVIQKTGQKVMQEMTQNLSQVSITDSNKSSQTKSLIDFDNDEDPKLLPPVMTTPLIPTLSTVDCKHLQTRDEYNDQQEAIEQFDPLGNSTSVLCHVDHQTNALQQQTSPNSISHSLLSLTPDDSH